MRIYAERPGRVLLQLLADAAVLAWVYVVVQFALAARDVVLQLQGPAGRLVGAGDAIRGAFDSAAATAAGVPFVGDDLARALGTADPVQLRVAGASVPRLWEDGVATGLPIARADPLGVRVLVGIDDPAEGAELTSPVRVTGEAAVFEATLRWEVRRDGAVIRAGSASTAEGQTFSPYSFSVPLPPGDYEIRVAEDDPSDGAGRPAMTDSRRVTVVS